MTLRKQLLIFFISLIIIPVVIIYLISISIFTRDTVNNRKKELFNQTQEAGTAIENYFNEAQNLSIYPLIEPTLKEYLKTDSSDPGFTSVKNDANSILSSMPYGMADGIWNIALISVSDQGFPISVGYSLDITADEKELLSSTYYKPYWYADLVDGTCQFYLLRQLRFLEDSMPRGYVKVALQTSSLLNCLGKYKYNHTDYFLIDESSTLLLSTEDNLAEELSAFSFDYNTLLALYEKEDCLSNKNTMITVHPIGKTPYLLCSLSQNDANTVMRNNLIQMLSIVAVFVVIFSIILSMVFTRIITRPLQTLKSSMDSLSDENFDIQIPEKGNNEISSLIRHFNQLAAKLKYLYNENYKGQLYLKQAQIDNLQTKINPHFLHNTLDTIYWMCKMGKNSEAAYMLSNLSDILRSTLAIEQKDTTTVRQELTDIQSYLNIQRIRKNNLIDFTVECPNECLELPTLKFILQPLIENALQHGFANATSGSIIIHIFMDQQCLCIDIKNNGTLIDTAEIDELLGKPLTTIRGFSLHNINDRLVLKYGDQYRLQYFTEDGYTVFRTIQPIKGGPGL